MKLKLKTEGLTGDNLKFVEQLNSKFEELPESLTKDDISTEIQTTFKEMFGEDGKVNFKFLDEIKDMNDAEKDGTIKNILKKQGEKITDLLTKVNSHETVNSFDEFKKEFESEATKAALKTIKANKSGQIAFTIKAAVVTTSTSSVTDSVSDATAQRLGDGNIYSLMRGTPWILNFVTTGNTTAAALIWYDESQKEGDFAITAEGTIKPLVQYKFVRKSSDYSKAAGRTTITEEFDTDYPRLVSTIKTLMQQDCRLAMNEIILTDLITNASPYAYNGLDGDIADPDDYAAMGAAIAQLQSLRYAPNVLVLNPADAWRMRLQKGNDGHWIMPPFTWNGQTYEFGNVIVDPDVTVGNFFIGDGSVYTVLMKGDIIVRIGYASSTNDFESNQYTMIVEQYFYNYISTARKAGLIYANFDTIKADIAAA